MRDRTRNSPQAVTPFVFGGIMRQLLEKILEKIKKTPGDYQAYEDLYFMCIDAMKEDRWLSVEFLKKLSEECEKAIKETLQLV